MGEPFQRLIARQRTHRRTTTTASGRAWTPSRTSSTWRACSSGSRPVGGLERRGANGSATHATDQPVTRFALAFEQDPPRRSSVLGAHPDDIEIGCGGERSCGWCGITRIACCIGSSSLRTVRAEKQRCGARPRSWAATPPRACAACLSGRLPPLRRRARSRRFSKRSRRRLPQRSSSRTTATTRHQDHRLIAELTWNTFRDHLILEYEIPKYDGDLGQPTFFVPLEARGLRAKVDT